MNYKLLIFSLSLLAISCSNEVENSDFAKDGFFDLEEFIDLELQKDLTLPSVTRNITLDDKKESTTIEDFNIEENLIYLKKFNINQPRWYDKYEVEKVNNKVIYISKDSSLRVERFEYVQVDDQVVSIDVKYNTGTFISSTRKSIHWEPGRVLKIDNQNKSFWTDPSRLQIEWQFLKSEN